MTKIYTPHTQRETAMVVPTPGFDFRGLSEKSIQSVLHKLEQRYVSPGMDPCVPICLTLDLSGSMAWHLDMIKKIIRQVVMNLSFVNVRLYMLEIVAIYNSEAKLVYFGDVCDLDLEAFIRSLPNPNGMTPYAEALTIGMDLMDRVYKTLEDCEHYYNPCGVLLTVTDTLENGSNGNHAVEITRAISNAMQNGTRVVTEFVTQTNQKGLISGGYKVFIDQDTSEHQLELFVNALRVGSSLVNKGTDDYKEPDQINRSEYNNYLARRLITEMNGAYEKRIKPAFVRG